ISDGTMIYVSETISGRRVEYRNAGPPTFQWDEVRTEAGYVWDSHAVYAGYNDRTDEQEEVPADDEWFSSLLENESNHLVYEQWHY
ncbi:hypothetical protein LX32DRAFT_587299, partial [Colletotrichum zoysiae]